MINMIQNLNSVLIYDKRKNVLTLTLKNPFLFISLTQNNFCFLWKIIFSSIVSIHFPLMAPVPAVPQDLVLEVK